ncbi:Mitochondrial carrier family protein [Aspergillus niger]|uniref:Mitochondrial carrier family protein n=1 Tax=Aspergillus niger TaxID=5061 RepID=A0A505HV09_ASPNG|nr:Mitochondrial carrier family protein [Aspergillus niger]
MEKQELQTSFLRKYFKSSTKLSQLPIEEQVALFREAISQNATLTKILSQALDLDLPEWYLASGCIFQTVWNVLTGRDPEAGIADYDLARVHLWYKENRGIDCPQHASAEAAIATFPTTTASLGVRLLPNGDWRIFAPHGFADLFDLIVRPNPVLTPPHVYKAKSERWQRQWPGLTVLPWPEAEVESSGQEEAGVGLASGVYIAPRLAP